jgi:2-polyprenyl-3-methyl-5-hydroxy-6-metoxy-1,4-benzoquinol methylase
MQRLMNKTRYEFGKNWLMFVSKVEERNFLEASKSLETIIDNKNRNNFIDIGCGSGIFSYSATRYYKNVLSLDIDKNSILATKKIRKKSNVRLKNWKIKTGSMLNKDFMTKNGKFDMVYCWGVAHHTGDMWSALDNLKILVKKNGRLFIAIYNDQGFKSKIWWLLKLIYINLPLFLKKIYFKFFELVFKFKNHKNRRGMNFIENLDDWIGGFPFEYSKMETLKKFYLKRGFKVLKSKKCHGHGCHEILFQKIK